MYKIVLITSLLAFSGAVFADDPCQSTSGPYGPVICTGGVSPSISANGPVTITGTVVQNAAQVNGTLTAQQATFNTLTVNGKVSLQNCVVKSTTNINGELTVDHSTFNDTLSISANNVELADSNTADIVIDNSGDGIVSPQTITLTGQTVVDGNITFKAKDGLVNVGPDAKITGQVIGGQIVQQVAAPVSTTASAPATPAIPSAPAVLAPAPVTNTTSTSSQP